MHMLSFLLHILIYTQRWNEYNSIHALFFLCVCLFFGGGGELGFLIRIESLFFFLFVF